ncbi:hypothetical protein [Rubellicoccus peritrichatus]|uniref:Uncharacterized protein n=1 Tax=Rubellicoccus peritrichatus TaxID=3080537 RepID=A0AAQ3LBF1_9BACT|nr:hypothetical protein [Puniceicoccus sp. CR14]WOO40378.1 hypothetical protein RZN69_17300 [Puniceicoccus sp. CR14]WOO40427.1 hypothetical protein RZN69_17545 [Puniceicoccus sp. CR14]WOO40476.1 hypothetical protein RZN69_17790 [Puniceicoccus sp. CR14]WOO40525.1 hypothetical protein RZN69_18035 [Puniceicoccus sp. CR14]
MQVTRQIEKALSRYLTSNNRRKPMLSTIQFLEGRSSETKKSPRCEVHCLEATYADGMPAGTGEYSAALAIMIYSSADEGRHRIHDKMAKGISDALCDQERVLTALNPPDEGPDLRAVKEIVFHELVPSGIQESTEDRQWLTTLVFEAQVFSELS